MRVGITSFFLILFLFFAPSAYAGKSYPELAHTLFENTVDILVAHGLCKDRQDCLHQHRLGAGGSLEHAKVSIYEARDIDPMVIVEIIKLYTSTYYDNKQVTPIRLRFYNEEAEEVVKWFDRPDPLIEILFKKIGD